MNKLQPNFAFIDNDGVELISLRIENADLKQRLVNMQQELTLYKNDRFYLLGKVDGMSQAIQSSTGITEPEQPNNQG